MLPVLQFVFSSFWTFLGTWILINAPGEVAAAALAAVRSPNR